jgi:hypothetical protein
VPVSYWFEDDDSLVHDPKAGYNLQEKIKELEDDKDFLKRNIEFLQEEIRREHGGEEKKNAG